MRLLCLCTTVPASHPAALTVSKHRAQLAAMRGARRSNRAATEGTDSEGQKKGEGLSSMLASLLSKWGSKDTADAATSAEGQNKDDKQAPSAQPSKDAAPVPEQKKSNGDAPASGSTPAKTSAADKPETDAPAKAADPVPAAAAPVKPADEQPAAAKKPEPAAPVRAAEPTPAAGADKKPVA